MDAKALSKILGELLTLNKELRVIDKTDQPIIQRKAEQVIDALSVQMTETGRQASIRSLRLGNYDTFGVLSIDASSFIRDIDVLMRDSLEGLAVNLVDGNDITPYTLAQSIELLKESSFMYGYLTNMTMAAIAYETKTPLGKFWMFLLNYVKIITANQQKKSYAVSYRFLEKVAKERQQITDVQIDFKPLFGYNTTDGVPDNSDFLGGLDDTTQKYFEAGKDYASTYFRKIKTIDQPFSGIV